MKRAFSFSSSLQTLTPRRLVEQQQQNDDDDSCLMDLETIKPYTRLSDVNKEDIIFLNMDDSRPSKKNNAEAHDGAQRMIDEIYVKERPFVNCPSIALNTHLVTDIAPRFDWETFVAIPKHIVNRLSLSLSEWIYVFELDCHKTQNVRLYHLGRIKASSVLKKHAGTIKPGLMSEFESWLIRRSDLGFIDEQTEKGSDEIATMEIDSNTTMMTQVEEETSVYSLPPAPPPPPPAPALYFYDFSTEPPQSAHKEFLTRVSIKDIVWRRIDMLITTFPESYDCLFSSLEERKMGDCISTHFLMMICCRLPILVKWYCGAEESFLQNQGIDSEQPINQLVDTMDKLAARINLLRERDKELDSPIIKRFVAETLDYLSKHVAFEYIL